MKNSCGARQWNFQTVCRGEQLQGLVSALAVESLSWTQLIQEDVRMSNNWDCRWLINVNFKKLINLVNIKQQGSDWRPLQCFSTTAGLSEASQCSGSVWTPRCGHLWSRAEQLVVCKSEKNVDKNKDHWKWDSGTALQHQSPLERREEWRK